MDLQRFQIHVCYLLPHHQMEPLFRQAGLEVTCLNHTPQWRGPRTFMKLLQLIHASGIDVVHTHGYLDRLFAHPAALVSRVPVVHTLNMVYEHAHDVRKRTSLAGRLQLALRHGVRYQLERLAVQRFIAISQAVYDSYAPMLPDARHRLTLIPYGVPTEEFGRPPDQGTLERLRRELALDGEGPVLINVARLVIAHKDQLSLIRAMRVVRQYLPGARLLIVGEGKDRPIIEHEIRNLHLNEVVLLLGNRHDVSALLALADVFVFPSRYEGFGLAVAEAMAAGKPVVASRVAPLTELVEDGGSGYLVQPGDSEALASAILRIAEDPPRAQEMGARGRLLAREKFDIARCARGWEEAYRAVVDG